MQCEALLVPYSACASEHLTTKQREVVHAPQVYREQAAAIVSSSR